MRYWKLWIWPGLAAAGCLTALAIWFEAAAIEAELQSRAVSALRQDHGWAKVMLKGRDLSVSGLAPDPLSQHQALDILRQIDGVRVVADTTALLPEEKPYRLTIEKTVDGVQLSGFVPNESARANLVSSLTGMLPGIALSDQLKLARGAPDALLALAGYGMSALPRFTTGMIAITGTSVRISGQALNPEDHELALKELSVSLPAGTDAEAIDISPAVVTGDYVWSAVLQGGALSLTGYVPDPETRKAIVARAKDLEPAVRIDDRMRFASGVPTSVDWQEAAMAGVAWLSSMTGGTVSIRGNVVDIVGEAADAVAFRSLEDALAAELPGGLVLGSTDLGVAQASLSAWSAKLTDQGLRLSGPVPSQAVRASIVETARLKFGNLQVDDTQTVSSDAPAGTDVASQVALQILSRLSGAEVVIAGGAISVRGTALNRAAANDVARLIADGLPEGYTGQSSIDLAAVATAQLPDMACQDELDRLSGLNIVRFEPGETAVQDHSYGFLDRIADAVRRCGDIRLEISGHTDSDGDDIDNLALSEARAQAVLEFMIKADVAPDRLIAKGYGESRPVKDNDTDAGKAANRRIEFRVLN
ncbi:OmpA family protein [Hoeflea sp. YIM 152468]|uniref:OmpA family protein n=1 Tax=Hoeflea sp. YIM 152468 TaxID=3031759 RepID=UPI0023D9D57A|nr:OmpA family protein [Hoeflea sp. YIM 152468]MDF1607723.1 OmpA family protein [Hoeflea sp. YIM 152468]